MVGVGFLVGSTSESPAWCGQWDRAELVSEYWQLIGRNGDGLEGQGGEAEVSCGEHR